MFKYQSFSQYSLANLLNDQLFMNHYGAFNDPFECWCKVESKFPKISDRSPRLAQIIKAWGFDDIDDTAKEHYHDYVSSLEGSQFDPQKLADAAKITCFSKRGDNLLMWSHYADGLRGFCIEYEPTTILGDNPKFASIYDVLYQNTPAVIDTALEAVHSDQIDYHGNAIEASTSESEIELLDEKLYENVLKSQEIYMKMLATKPKEWSYEEEKRIIYLSTDRDDSLLAYPSSSIKRVIFGEKMPQNQVQTILNLFAAKGLSLTVQYARRASSAFKVELVERI